MPESSPTNRARTVMQRLSRLYPVPRTELTWTSPWELLAATILSAQCTDARVNHVTPRLFDTWKNVQEMATADPAKIEEVIRSTGFFRNKAKSLRGSAERIVSVFSGHVPRTMEEMLTLPGVARKTANVVLSNAFGVHAGIAVDTHVKRISFRLGLTQATNPDKVEKDLVAVFPQNRWGDINHYLVLFGRHVCTARKPACHTCVLADVCPRSGMSPLSTHP